MIPGMIPAVVRVTASDLLSSPVGYLLLGSIIFMLLERRLGARTAQGTESGAWSVECGLRVMLGSLAPLRRTWRPGRAVLGRGSIEVSLFRWGVRTKPLASVVIPVASVDRRNVRRGWWRTALSFSPWHRVVTVRTTSGVHLQLALAPGDVAMVLDVLEGLPHPQPLRPGALPVPATSRTLHVVAPLPGVDRAPGTEGDVAAQLDALIDEVETSLALQQMSLADVERIDVRTTDVHAVTSTIEVLARRLSAAGATPRTSVLHVEALPLPHQLVELEALAQKSVVGGLPTDMTSS